MAKTTQKSQTAMEKILEGLLHDIAAGYGNKFVPVPTTNTNSDSICECTKEVSQLWMGENAITRFELLENILSLCSCEELYSQMAAVIMYHFPETNERLTSKYMSEVIAKSCGKTKNRTAVTTTSGVTPIKSPSSPEKSAKLTAHQEKVEAVKETLKERAELAQKAANK